MTPLLKYLYGPVAEGEMAIMVPDSDLISRKPTHIPGVFIYKYIAGKTMFKGHWPKHVVQGGRGHIMTQDLQPVNMPLPKMFNVGEMGLDLPDDYPVCAFIKRNGFMLDVTWSKKLNQLIIGTTGTTTSEYAKLGASYITENMIPIFQEWADVTFTFEVCDPSDPHIAVEVPGLYLLAARVVDWNSDYNLMVSKYYRDEILDSFKQAGADFFFEHPQEGVTMGDIKKQCETVDHEGFVVWFNLNTDTDTRCYPLKVKSRRYVAMKKLARAKNDVISKILWSHEFEYLYKDNQALLQMLGALRQDTVFFIRMNEQERLKFMRAVLEAFDDEAMGE